MKLDDLFLLAVEAKRLTNHEDFVIVGSLSVLGVGAQARIPSDMLMSNDVDCYTRSDPERLLDVVPELGETSAFFNRHQFYLDPVSPRLLTLPDGWEARMKLEERDGLRLWFLDPNDAAISKYARYEPRDVRWIRSGLAAGLISIEVVRSRMKQTLFLDIDEERRVREQVEVDALWIARRS